MGVSEWMRDQWACWEVASVFTVVSFGWYAMRVCLWFMSYGGMKYENAGREWAFFSRVGGRIGLWQLMDV
jgi:hypothetical protein